METDKFVKEIEKAIKENWLRQDNLRCLASILRMQGCTTVSCIGHPTTANAYPCPIKVECYSNVFNKRKQDVIDKWMKNNKVSKAELFEYMIG